LPTEEQVRVVDLITSRYGVFHPAANDGDSLEYAPPRGSQRWGRLWLYGNWDFDTAVSVFEQLTGKDIYDALRHDLAVPLEMRDFDRDRPQRHVRPEHPRYPAYTMWLSTRDMARLGYLMLRRGRWRDRQLIPAGRVRRITASPLLRPRCTRTS
jgi:CubicO group peptidase (beta-lactamase class C family)